ncbi:hypothetical protein [Micromonospora sp. 067-2]|uniref:hypothetical protein n=1 Tax=Micromonospora sp. 067-2 TaxID=2789270 RepID=UPI00397B73D6
MLVGGCRPDEARRADRPLAGPTRSDVHTAVGDRGDLRDATFVLVNGADVVRVRSADLGDDLYRVSTPAEAKVRPAVTVADGSVLAGLAASDGAGPALVEVTLNEAVRWRVRLGGGAQEETLDLRSGLVDEVEFAAGTNRAEVTLPPAKGTIRVSMTGGASRLLVHLAGDAPVQVRAGGGAARVTVDGDSRSGVAGGTTLTPAGWAAAGDRYDIDAVAGVSELTVDRTP